jgi:hypothetical protein
MAAQLRIEDGNPVWLSHAILPSKDTVLSPMSSPTVAVIQQTSADVFVYVKVDNTGTVDFGTCSCVAIGAWAAAPAFTGFLADPAGAATETQAGTTFNASPGGDSLSGFVNFNFGSPAGGRRTWAWSPDGRFFAHAASTGGNAWALKIVTLQAIPLPDGTTVAAGVGVVSTTGAFAAAWNQNQFGWAGSKAVVVAGTATAGVIALTVACPEVHAPGNVYTESLPAPPAQIDYSFLVSPCASVVAIMPRVLDVAAGTRDARLVSTASASIIPFRQGNANFTVTVVSANPSMTTNSHTANGVRINTGAGATVDVDDPDCTAVGGGAVVHVDRVKASTLPSANLGVVHVGTSAASAIAPGQSRWVQVPPPNGWINGNETHWCLLAQTFTSDPTVIPQPWDGHTSPTAFPLAAVNTAQRNIDIA